MRLKSKLFCSYIFFVVVYSCFSILPAPLAGTLARYRVSALGLRLINVTIILILASIWYAGFYGYSKLQAYSQIIKHEKDGKPVTTICNGLLLLALWLPVSSVTSVILNYIAEKHIGLVPTVAILNNYINLLFPLAGFILVGLGSQGLSKLIRRRRNYRAANILAILLVYIGLTFFRLVVTTPNRAAIYHLSVWFLLITLVAPYIYMRFIGIGAAFEIYLYQRMVAGVVYRKGWRFLGLGLCWLIVTSIGFQFLATLSVRLQRLSIYWILAVLYSLLIVLSIGFLFIAIGTRKLQRLEEV